MIFNATITCTVTFESVVEATDQVAARQEAVGQWEDLICNQCDDPWPEPMIESVLIEKIQ